MASSSETELLWPWLRGYVQAGGGVSLGSTLYDSDREQTPERFWGYHLAAGAGLQARGKRSRAIAEARADWVRNSPRLLEAYQMAIDQGRAR